MAISLKDFSAAGVQVSDEVVLCNELHVIGSVNYYFGYLNYTCNSNIMGNTDADNCVWSGAGKTGTRYAAYLDGYPASGSVSIDKLKGIVISPTSTSYYVSYTAHNIIKRGGSEEISVPFELSAGEAITIAQLKFPTFRNFAYCAVDIQGNNPSSTATITLSNGTQSQSVTLSTSSDQYIVEFTDLLKVTTAQTLVVSTTNGYGAYDVTLRLYEL